MSVFERLGAAWGSVADRTGLVGSLINALDPDTWLPGGRDAAFTFALIALSAKMAVSDGVVTASEWRAFERNVVIPPTAARQVERLFQLAQQDVAGFEVYARKVRRLFAKSPETLEHVLDSLFQIAAADGMVHQSELGYLKAISDIFGFDTARFEQITAQHVALATGADPYAVLGLIPDAPPEEVKRVYRTLVSEHHPDRLIAKGVPAELVDLATARLQAINAAYRQITRGTA